MGDDNAGLYFEISSTGEITVQNDLTAAPGDEIVYKVIIIKYYP